MSPRGFTASSTMVTAPSRVNPGSSMSPDHLREYAATFPPDQLDLVGSAFAFQPQRHWNDFAAAEATRNNPGNATMRGLHQQNHRVGHPPGRGQQPTRAGYQPQRNVQQPVRDRPQPNHGGRGRRGGASGARGGGGRGGQQVFQPPRIPPVNQSDPELVLRVIGIPSSWSTKRCFDIFSQYGNLTAIYIFHDKQTGISKGEAKLTFRPIPREEFWHKPFELSLGGNPPVKRLLGFRLMDSNEWSKQQNAERVQVRAKQVGVGVMQSQGLLELFTSQEYPRERRSQAHRFSPITMTMNPEYHEMMVEFPVHFVDVNPNSVRNRTDVLRATFTLRQRLLIHYAVDPADPHVVTLVFNSEVVPKYYRKGEEDRFFNDCPLEWNERDSYYRQTDVVLDPQSPDFKTQPARLRHVNSVIDLGRWTAYAVTIDIHGKEEEHLNAMLNVLRAFNVDVQMNSDIKALPGRHAPLVWDFIDPPEDVNSNSLSALLAQTQPLNFDVRYQLEVCISGGWLNEYDLSRDWVEQLRALDPMQACALLEHIAIDRPEDRSRRIQDPFSIFRLYAPKQSVLALRVPKGKVIIRSATITPTTVIFNTPSLEISNRVIRQYQKHADRFLRVRFLDERTLGRIYGRSDKSTDDEIFTRVKRVLVNGFNVGDRHYDLLAWGNSQFRENGAYFFSNTKAVTADDIRRWMGDFSDIKVVAKYAARIGQCFSTTRAVTCGTPTLLEIPDVERGKHCFTDGVGKISPFIAGMAGTNFRYVVKAEEVPSAYQFRLGGWKGVLAVWPDVKGFNIHLRPSQNKFKAFKAELEIIRHSQATEFSLNRQLIMVLSALGIPNKIFLDKADQQLKRIHKAMEDPETAKEALRSTVDANHITPEIADMVAAGFQASREPFLMSLLLLWRAWSIKYLKEKAKIHIKQGAVVIGVTDEAEVLQGHFEHLQHKLKSKDPEERKKAVPEVFLQLSNFEGTGQSKVITGLMIMARNPSLHAGDIRVVKGVDHKRLRHLKDVVVLPQTGDRDLASMCSGGDLDGDDYLVSWDEKLIPPEWNVPALAFDPPASLKSEHVTLDDLTSFYVRYMKNTELGQIAHHHLAHADRSPDGVKSENCIRLAELHSNAVDYPKTGVPATIPKDLKIKEWPHYMEKRKSYKSRSALGKLFDSVHREKFEPPYDNPFDKHVLEAHPTTPELEEFVREIKVKYDAALRRLMQQHGIKTEFEVWSTFVMEYNGTMGDYKFAEELGHDVSAIKEQYIEICIEKAGGRQHEHLAPFVVAMYKVTQQQINDALYEAENIRLDQDGNVMEMRDMSASSMPFMSFPWLFSNIMCKLARVSYAMAGDHKLARVEVLKLDDPVENASAALGKVDLKDKEIANYIAPSPAHSPSGSSFMSRSGGLTDVSSGHTSPTFPSKFASDAEIDLSDDDRSAKSAGDAGKHQSQHEYMASKRKSSEPVNVPGTFTAGGQIHGEQDGGDSDEEAESFSMTPSNGAFDKLGSMFG